MDKRREIHSAFADSSVMRCPFCYQPLNDSYKNEMLESIKKSLHEEELESKEALEQLLEKLNTQRAMMESVDLEVFSALEVSIAAIEMNILSC